MPIVGSATSSSHNPSSALLFTIAFIPIFYTISRNRFQIASLFWLNIFKYKTFSDTRRSKRFRASSRRQIFFRLVFGILRKKKNIALTAIVHYNSFTGFPRSPSPLLLKPNENNKMFRLRNLEFRKGSFLFRLPETAGDGRE